MGGHGFSDLVFDTLIAGIYTGNERSTALARRLGMTPRSEPVERAGMTHLVWERRA
jgi:RimJ/RimL family protein N-acetyltransferase